jgi:hypothetical protein
VKIIAFLDVTSCSFAHTTDLLKGTSACVLRLKKCLLGRRWSIKFSSKHTYEVCLKGNETESVHKEFVPQEQTANVVYYSEVLERLTKRIHRVRPEIADTWMPHHNAPFHTAISVNEFWTKMVFHWFSSLA